MALPEDPKNQPPQVAGGNLRRLWWVGSAYRRLRMGRSVAVAEEAEEVDEEVDEIEVEGEGAEGGKASVGHTGIGLGHLTYLLGVPGGEADEEHYTDDAHDPVEGGAMGEDVDYQQYQQSEEAHVEDRTHACQGAVGEITVDAHGAEHSGGDHKGLGYGAE